MADKPILFSAPMVRAILDGRKTQTRRIIKPRKHASLFSGEWTDDYVLDPGNESWRQEEIRVKVGDTLWVRETWRAHSWHGDCVEIAYAAQRGLVGWTEQHLQIPYPNGNRNAFKYYSPKGPDFWRPSLFMPRWASRLTLTVTEVRVERLQDISEADAKAEGVSDEFCDYELYGQSQPYRFGYSSLWNLINGEGAWQANPWVAVYDFTAHRGNIDQIARVAA